MDKIKRSTYKDWIWILAVFIMVVCLVEGFFYYAETEDKYFMLLLNIQNAIKAYKIDPDIKIKDALEFAHSHSDNYLLYFTSYLYTLVVILAPFCTIAALTMLVKTHFQYLKGNWRKLRKRKTLLIIGEGIHKENFIDAIASSQCRVSSIETRALDEKKKIDYLSQGIRIVMKYRGEEPEVLYKNAWLESKDNILICYDNPLSSLSELKHITDFYESRGKKKKMQTIYIVCTETGIADIIKQYYEANVLKPAQELGRIPAFDLYVVDIKKNAVDKMFRNYPIYDYNEKLYRKTAKLDEKSFDVHMGIIGFGEYGQKLLIEAMSQSVFSAESQIVLDVFDKKMAEVFHVFMKSFSPLILQENMQKEEKDGPFRTIRIGRTESGTGFGCDGSLEIRFWNIDTDTIHFTDIFYKKNKEMPYTYIVVAMDTEKRMATAVLEMKRFVNLVNTEGIMPTIMVRTKENDDVFLLMNQEQDSIVPYRNDTTVYSFAEIEKADIIKEAMQFHYRYQRLADIVYEMTGGKEKADFLNLLTEEENSLLVQKVKELDRTLDPAEVLKEWYGTNFYKRESSIDQSLHQSVKKWLYGNGADKGSLGEAVQKNNVFQTKEYKEKLEHRRWTHFMISHGYAYSEQRNDHLKMHDCILDFETLKQKKPDTLEYDYTPYLLMYCGEEKNEITK